MRIKKYYVFMLLIFMTGCATTSEKMLTMEKTVPTDTAAVIAAPTPIPTPAEYTLAEPQVQKLQSATGVKAVVMGKNQNFVYSINLEDMSIYEFDRKSRKLNRQLRFVPTKGWGFNYSTKKKISSFEEKPVEAHLTHNDRFLWISLHNAGGIVVWDLQDGNTFLSDKPYKSATLTDYSEVISSTDKPVKKTIKCLFIPTGKTPKVITSTHDGKWLYVANWHSNSVSVINISDSDPATWKVEKNISPFYVPRGMVVTPDDKFLLVAQMGSHYLSKVDIASQKIIASVHIGENPRHLVYDEPYLYVSLNKGAELLKFDLIDEKITTKVSTETSPRTIALSKDNKYVFVVCYHANKLQVFKTSDLSKTGEFNTFYRPVAVDIAQADDYIEAWVGNYSSGTIDVFRFEKKYTTE